MIITIRDHRFFSISITFQFSPVVARKVQIQFWTFVVNENPREDGVLIQIVVASTGDGVEKHEILEVGYLSPLPALRHVGHFEQLLRVSQRSTSAKEIRCKGVIFLLLKPAQRFAAYNLCQHFRLRFYRNNFCAVKKTPQKWATISERSKPTVRLVQRKSNVSENGSRSSTQTDRAHSASTKSWHYPTWDDFDWEKEKKQN